MGSYRMYSYRKEFCKTISSKLKIQIDLDDFLVGVPAKTTYCRVNTNRLGEKYPIQALSSLVWYILERKGQGVCRILFQIC